MSSIERTILAALVLVGLTVGMLMGKISEPGGLTTIGVIVGYVCGDRNGEKRLANAVVATQSLQPAVEVASKAITDNVQSPPATR